MNVEVVELYQREIVCSELVYAVYVNEAWPTSVSTA